ncbi:hypothetical protein BraRD5C2_28190 [Bradyrhizobium sp. RD5-C2]|nr:hypothetical protein BraRD5C2_28190 [Bradyrhizobium sp. RD5-C2]
MLDQSVAAVAVALEAKAVMRLAELRIARQRVVDTRRMQLTDQRCRQYALTIERALTEMQPHPAREIRDRGGHRTRRGGRDRQTERGQPRVFVDLVGPRRLAGRFEIIEVEADIHAEPVGQARADERLIALPAQALNQQAHNIVAEVVVLKCAPDIAVQFQMPHQAEHVGRREIAGLVHPVMAWQPGMMTQQIEHGDALCRHRIAETKLGDIVAYRFGPIEPPPIVQQRDRSGGEGFGDRADRELRRRRNRQIRLDIALAVGACEHDLVVLHHGERDARHLPVGHDVGGETIELGNIGCNLRTGRVGRLGHDGLSASTATDGASPKRGAAALRQPGHSTGQPFVSAG